MLKVELALVCIAVKYGEIWCNDKGSTESRTFLPLHLKLAPQLSTSHCQLEARPLQFQASYTVERKLEIREFTLCLY